jgi:hypothetical protein
MIFFLQNNINTACNLLAHLAKGNVSFCSQQPENCENRNDPDLVQAFLMKWWVESDFKAPNLPLSLRSHQVSVHLTEGFQRIANFVPIHQQIWSP